MSSSLTVDLPNGLKLTRHFKAKPWVFFHLLCPTSTELRAQAFNLWSSLTQFALFSFTFSFLYSDVDCQPTSRAHRRCGTLVTSKPLVFDALASRELPLDALLSFPINWSSYLQTSTRGQQARPNLNPLQRTMQQTSGHSSGTYSSSSSSSSSTSCPSTSTTSLRSSSRRDDRPPRAKKQFLAPLPTSQDCGCGQLLGSSESSPYDSGLDEGALGLINLDLALEEESSCPPTPALSDSDSIASTPTSTTPPPFLSSPQVSFRMVDYKLKAEEEIIKLNQPLVSPFSEEPPKDQVQEEATRWREWERMCVNASASP